MRAVTIAILMAAGLCGQSTTTVRGNIGDAVGGLGHLIGTCYFSPATPSFTSADGWIVIAAPHAQSFSSGIVTVPLVPTDSASGTYYQGRCEIPLQTADGRDCSALGDSPICVVKKYTYGPFYLQVPTSSSVVNLKDIIVNRLPPPPPITILPSQISRSDGITTPYLQLAPSSLPQGLCDATRRGKFWPTQGSSGVADKIQVCGKQIDGTYKWGDLAVADPYLCMPTGPSVSAYTCTTNPANPPNAAGISVALTVPISNASGGVTLDVGFGAKAIKLGDGTSDLPNNLLLPNIQYLISYDGSIFKMINGPNISLSGVPTVGGCPMFPANTIFHTDISGAPRDDFGTLYYFGHPYRVLGGSWSASVAYLTLDSTDGLATGEVVYINKVSPDGYNTGYGSNANSAEVGVRITVIDSAHISFPLASDPGNYIAGGYLAVGPYGTSRSAFNQEFGLNTFTNADPAFNLWARFSTTYRPFVPFTYASITANDNYPVYITNSSIGDGANSDGSPFLISQMALYPASDAHVLSLNTSTCDLLEIFGLESLGPPFYALSESRWNTQSTDMRTARIHNQADSNGVSSADAAGLPIWPLVGPSHAQLYGSEPDVTMHRFTIPRSYGGYTWPGTHMSSGNVLINYLPMAAAVRLRGDYDTTTCHFGVNDGLPFPDGTGGTPNMKKWMVGRQKYGGILADNGGAFLWTGTQDFTQAESDTISGWMNCFVGGDAWESVNLNPLQLKADSYEVAPFKAVTRSALTQVSLASIPAGLKLSTDGGALCLSPCLLGWDKATSHTITAPTQTNLGTQYTFASWNDGGAASHSVSASVPTTYTATFTPQYQLTTSVTPTGGGSILPASGSFRDSGTVVSVSATPNAGYQFVEFTGTDNGPSYTTPANVTMGSAKSVVAQFGVVDPTAWYNTNWLYRKSLTIDHTKVAANQTNFPASVVLLDADLAGLAQSNGNDILFTASDGVTKVAHEIEVYTTLTGSLVAWVNIPSLSSTVDTTIYMYYGNSAATNQQNVAGVWDSNYKGVYHLGNGTTLSVADSTANAKNGSGATLPAVGLSGKIDGDAIFNGTSNFITIPSNTLSTAGDFTVTLWYNKVNNSSANNDRLFAFLTDANNYFMLATDNSSGKYAAQLNRTGTAVINGTAYTAFSGDLGVWHRLTYTVSGSTGTFYRDGVAVSSTGTTTVGAGASFAYDIGARPDGNASCFANGQMDEVRLSNIARSASWIATEYANQNSPSTFLSKGVQQHQ